VKRQKGAVSALFHLANAVAAANLASQPSGDKKARGSGWSDASDLSPRLGPTAASPTDHGPLPLSSTGDSKADRGGMVATGPLPLLSPGVEARPAIDPSRVSEMSRETRLGEKIALDTAVSGTFVRRHADSKDSLASFSKLVQLGLKRVPPSSERERSSTSSTNGASAADVAPRASAADVAPRAAVVAEAKPLLTRAASMEEAMAVAIDVSPLHTVVDPLLGLLGECHDAGTITHILAVLTFLGEFRTAEGGPHALAMHMVCLGALPLLDDLIGSEHSDVRTAAAVALESVTRCLTPNSRRACMPPELVRGKRRKSVSVRQRSSLRVGAPTTLLQRCPSTAPSSPVWIPGLPMPIALASPPSGGDMDSAHSVGPATAC